MGNYKCPDCGFDECIERTKLEWVDLFGLDYPSYKEVKILRCAKCNTRWPLKYYDILHEK